MADKYISINDTNDQKTEIEGTVTSTGVSEAGKIVALDSNGKLDSTLLPTGVGAETVSVLASENLAAGDFVNTYNNAGTLNVRKADADNNRAATGFVLANVTSGNNATVYLAGINNQLSSLTPGAKYFLGTTAGAVSTDGPTTSNALWQALGKAISDTAISVVIDADPIKRA